MERALDEFLVEPAQVRAGGELRLEDLPVLRLVASQQGVQVLGVGLFRAGRTELR
jgi:hypothetical protein